ncbi:toxic anion resistance protein [Mucilaginibacter achroorhodeus]|uniref:Toxic anion resistance protein n=1 Tax=Mucilaginibacter achroorhodeus TaxID=2599294 RepID=A0A563U2K7_9SPHI|nr:MULTISPECIES: toxic anion resistance protein [Mucilaginibacter]QXV64128.1 toxic anion resistance protein [Mucilaginibacter sp. 21P]TWR25578.1 toxic anion resistance protein [Mucilaginibacter achroorhodeus]
METNSINDGAELTNPAPTPAPGNAATPVKLDKDGNVDLSNITTAEVAKYGEKSKDLNPSDVNSILNYGSDLQQNMERYSNSFLSSVRTFDAGEVGTLITDLLHELNYIDVDELDQNAFVRVLSRIPLIRTLVMDTKKIFAKYDLVVNNVDKIVNKIKAGRVNSLKDNASLQTMFDNNVDYIKQMEELIIAGQLKYNELNEKLAVMDGNPSGYQDYEIADLRDYVNRLDKRLADLKVVRFIMLQSLAQIRVVQNNNTTIAEKAQSIVSTTIPVWKNQLTLAVALNRQKANVEMQKKVSDTTNTILQKNAELLKQNSIDVARENEKTVVSLDTLKRTTSSLIETLNEVKRIHDEGTQNRKVLNTELQNLETELKKNVTNTR